MNATPHTTLCLTTDQITDLLIADDPNTLSLASRRRHLSACPACNAEFLQLEALLGGLRDSATASAAQVRAQAPATILNFSRPSPATASRKAVWAFAAAVLTFAAALPFVHHAGLPTTTAEVAAPVIGTRAVAPVISDDALLDGISQDLSASVPSSLEPLTDPAGKLTSAQPDLQ